MTSDVVYGLACVTNVRALEGSCRRRSRVRGGRRGVRIEESDQRKRGAAGLYVCYCGACLS